MISASYYWKINQPQDGNSNSGCCITQRHRWLFPYNSKSLSVFPYISDISDTIICTYVRSFIHVPITQYSLFISFSDRSRSAFAAWPLTGVPVLEDDEEVEGRRLSLNPSSWLTESRRPAPKWELASWGLEGVREVKVSSYSPSSKPGEMLKPGGESGDVENPRVEAVSARELCFTELRLWARTRDQLVDRKLSASSQKRARCSAECVTMKCR